MNITLKNIKHAEFASHETNCFTANIYLDKKKIGEAENDGHGGETILHFVSSAVENAFRAFCKAQLPLKTEWGPVEMTAELYVEMLLEVYLKEREEKKMQKRVQKEKERLATMGCLTVQIDTPACTYWVGIRAPDQKDRAVEVMQKKYGFTSYKAEII